MEKISTVLKTKLEELSNTLVVAVNAMKNEIIEDVATIKSAKARIEENSAELSDIACVLEEFVGDMATVIDHADNLTEVCDEVVDAIDDIPEVTVYDHPDIDLTFDQVEYEIDENGKISFVNAD